MESSLTFLERISGVLIFCMALSILFIENSILQNTITSLKKAVNSQEVLYEQSLEVINEEKITYAGVIGMLMEELTFDITINNLEIKKEDYNPQTFDFSGIYKTSYSKSYELDSQGNIVKIIFIP